LKESIIFSSLFKLIVAEGIEDEFSLNWLTEHDCELAQGYFISRPKPASELTSWLVEQKTPTMTATKVEINT